MGDGNGHHGHGHGHNNFRNKVWRMSDGPYCRPKHWKHNTSIATVCIVLIYIPIAMKSAKLEKSNVEYDSRGAAGYFQDAKSSVDV
ncbi:hypothetical protein JHK87_024708 [Glycine soja]|nr:hypothetical protein JHK87_024708 [Glycine soja]